MADAFGIQRAIDNVTARVGEWLSVPVRIRDLYARVQDPGLRDRIAAVDADYQATKNLIQQGLDITQRAKAAQALPPLGQVPLLLSAAAALLDITANTKKLESAAGGTAAAGEGWAGNRLVLYGTGAAAVTGLLYLVLRRRRRRSR